MTVEQALDEIAVAVRRSTGHPLYCPVEDAVRAALEQLWESAQRELYDDEGFFDGLHVWDGSIRDTGPRSPSIK